MKLQWLTNTDCLRILFQRKHLKALAVLLALCVLGHSFAHARTLKPQPEAFLDIHSFLQANNIRSLDDYILWLAQNVTYSTDITKDDWADPLVTLNNKTGDCEDIAFLNAEVLKYYGYEPQVLAYGRDKEAHVICLFMKEGKYYIFDNTKFYRDIVSPSLKEIFLFLVKKHNARYLLQLSQPRQLRVLYVFQGNQIT